MSDNLPSIIGSSATLPAHLQQYAGKAQDAASMVTSFQGLPKLSIRGSRFRYTKNDKEIMIPAGTPMEVVILAVDPPTGMAKSLYEGAFIEGSEESPDCASSDGKRPDGNIETPKSPGCDACEYNQWGSGIDGAGNATKGKRCSDHKNLFLVAANDIDGDIAVLRVPATSLKALSAFGRELAHNNVPMQGVITALSFTDATHPQLDFKAIGWLDAEQCVSTMARSECEELQGALPSKNSVPSRQTSGVSQLPPPPAKQTVTLIATDKCTAGLDKMREAKWSDKQLLDNGYATEQVVEPEPEAAPPPPAEEPAAPPPPEKKTGPTMTEKAGKTTYESFKAKGWTDDQLITQGYMTK